MCTLQKTHKELPIEMHTRLKNPALNTHSLHTAFSFPVFPSLSLSHALPWTSGWASLTAQYKNGPFSLPFFSSLCLPAAVGWELTANKKSSLFLVPQKIKKGDWSILCWVVCFSSFLCALLQILASFNVVLIREREWFITPSSCSLAVRP